MPIVKLEITVTAEELAADKGRPIKNNCGRYRTCPLAVKATKAIWDAGYPGHTVDIGITAAFVAGPGDSKSGPYAASCILPPPTIELVRRIDAGEQTNGFTLSLEFEMPELEAQ